MRRRSTRGRFLVAVLALACGFGSEAAIAQAATEPWPTRTIRILVPYAAGGSTDILSRLLAQKLTEILGQSVVVENRGGAAGSVGAASFAKGSLDDHSFMMVTPSQLSINQYLYKARLGYDPVADLRPVGLVAETTNAIVIASNVPVTTFKAFLDYAKARPGTLSYSSAGIGSTGHLLNELMKRKLGLDIVHVPYRGNGPAMQAVVAGEVQMNTDNLPQLLSQVEAGKVRALAVTSEKRWSQLPDVPTVGELGYPWFDTVVWFGLVAQAKVPDQVVATMNRSINSALADPAFLARLRENSLQGTPGTPETMADLAERDRRRWKDIVESSGAVVE